MTKADNHSTLGPTAATVAILLHLFCLAIGVASNAGGRQSTLGQALRNIPVAPQYLRTLFMDVGYDFELSGVNPDNGLYQLALLSADAGSNELQEVARLPVEHVGSRVRQRRYQNLAYHVAEFDRVFSESPDDQTLLPIAIAENWVDSLDLDLKQFTLRCERTDAARWESNEAAFDAAGKAAKTSDNDLYFDVHVVWSPLENRFESFRAQPNNLTAKAVDQPSN